jgi:hypothetical protein
MEDQNGSQTKSRRDSTVCRPVSGPALNALTHGLTATKRLPEILGSELVHAARRQFYEEWKPATATEQHLVDELARHAAALARAEHIEDGLLRTSARGFSLTSFAAEDADLNDKILAACVGAEALDRLTRHRRAHERAFLATLERIHQMHGDRPQHSLPSAPVARPPRFEEDICRAYLRRRWEEGVCSCPACKGKVGPCLSGRDLWQCRSCRHQSGLRSGTIMVRSSLSLSAWFTAIYALFRDPEITIDALCKVTRISRRKTVVALAQRIRRALCSADSERLLADLTCEILEELGRSSR